MKKFTFAFYPNGYLSEISIIAENKENAVALVREMIADCYLDDGLFFNDEEDYNG